MCMCDTPTSSLITCACAAGPRPTLQTLYHLVLCSELLSSADIEFQAPVRPSTAYLLTRAKPASLACCAFRISCQRPCIRLVVSHLGEVTSPLHYLGLPMAAPLSQPLCSGACVKNTSCLSRSVRSLASHCRDWVALSCQHACGFSNAMCVPKCLHSTPLCCRSVSGLSLDFQLLNMLGFACYAAYNVSLFCVPSIREEYQQLYSGNIPVGTCHGLQYLLLTETPTVSHQEAVECRARRCRLLCTCSLHHRTHTRSVLSLRQGGAEDLQCDWQSNRLHLCRDHHRRCICHTRRNERPAGWPWLDVDPVPASLITDQANCKPHQVHPTGAKHILVKPPFCTA